MPRVKVKSWKNARHGWSRRMMWYEGEDDIRIKFEDQSVGVANKFYSDEQMSEAQADWLRFKLNQPVQVLLDGQILTF